MMTRAQQQNAATKRYRARHRQRYLAAKRAYELKLKFGITLEQYNEKLTAQGGGCAICGSTSIEPGRTRMHIDHSHDCCPGAGSCGKCVRSILCAPCNLAIGHLHDDANKARKLAEYLESWS